MKKFLATLAFFCFGTYLLGWFYCRLVYPAPHRPLLKQVSSQYQLDPLLVGAIIFTESRWNEKAVSPAGALGWMQVMPLTAAEVARELGWRDFASEDLFQREQNVQIGCHYFAKLKRRLGNVDWMALAAYNAGESKIRAWVVKNLALQSRSRALAFPETRHYVRKIEMLYLGLRFCRALRLVALAPSRIEDRRTC